MAPAQKAVENKSADNKSVETDGKKRSTRSKPRTLVEQAFPNTAIRRMIQNQVPKREYRGGDSEQGAPRRTKAGIRVNQDAYPCVRAVLDTEIDTILRRAVVRMAYNKRSTLQQQDVADALQENM